MLNPRSIQIAAVATATIVAFGFAVASATKSDPKPQPTVETVSPGAAAVEKTENDDAATPEPSATPTSAATHDNSDNDDNGDDHSNSDDQSSDEHADDVFKNWNRRWKQKLEHDRDARRGVHTFSNDDDQKKFQKKLRKYVEHHNRGNQFGQQQHDN